MSHGKRMMSLVSWITFFAMATSGGVLIIMVFMACKLSVAGGCQRFNGV